MSNVQKADRELRIFMVDLVKRYELTSYETIGMLEAAKAQLILLVTASDAQAKRMAATPGG